MVAISEHNKRKNKELPNICYEVDVNSNFRQILADGKLAAGIPDTPGRLPRNN